MCSSDLWWESHVAMAPAGHVFTWVEFQTAFRAAYIPKPVMDLKRREFLGSRLSRNYGASSAAGILGRTYLACKSFLSFSMVAGTSNLTSFLMYVPILQGRVIRKSGTS